MKGAYMNMKKQLSRGLKYFNDNQDDPRFNEKYKRFEGEVLRPYSYGLLDEIKAQDDAAEIERALLIFNGNIIEYK